MTGRLAGLVRWLAFLCVGITLALCLYDLGLMLASAAMSLAGAESKLDGWTVNPLAWLLWILRTIPW